MNKKKILASLGALMIGAVGISGSALAADPGDILGSETGSLTVHKFAKAPGEIEGSRDGSAVDPDAFANLTPLQGVTFTAQKINQYDGKDVDLSKESGWDALDGFKSNFEEGKATLGDAVEKVTAENGEAKFEKLAVGAYWVKETADTGNNNITDKAKPFLVTVPMPGKTAGTWNYDIHAYPKNSTATADKQFVPGDAHSYSDVVSWGLSVEIPAFGEGNTLTSLKFEDQLPAELSLATDGVTVKGGDTDFVKDTDFTVSEDGKKVTITINDTGRAKLKAGDKVVANVKTNVDTAVKGAIKNDATVTVNDANMKVEDSSYWGSLKINKTATGTETRLKGAEFQVFASEQDAKDLKNPISGAKWDGNNVFTTNEQGEIVLDGILTAETGTTLYVREITAPAGYVKDDTVHAVNVLPNDQGAVEITVENAQRTTNPMPELGSSGMIALYSIVGLAVAGALATAGIQARKSAVK